MVTVETIFERLGGPAEVGRMLGKTTEHATLMRRRGSIPPPYWASLVEAAAARGIDDLSADVLLRAHEATRQIKAAERARRKAAA